MDSSRSDSNRTSDWTSERIVRLRGSKNLVDPWVPYAYLLEEEVAASGLDSELVTTIFLTNRECPFRCTMCDLWRNTTDEVVPLGAIPAQIDYAIAKLSERQSSSDPSRGESTVIKLYNSGNFFDRQAIPRNDWNEIASRVHGYDRVIVETHPRLLEGVEEFQALIGPAELEVAMGLESVHPGVLARLNKQMTTDDFASACQRLRSSGIAIRAFLLLQPPWLGVEAGMEWTLRTVDFARQQGVNCCSIVPTRDGNGAMEALARQGLFQLPTLSGMEQTLHRALLDEDARSRTGVARSRGRILMDLWDAERFAACPECRDSRLECLKRMNETQRAVTMTDCNGCGGDGIAQENPQ